MIVSCIVYKKEQKLKCSFESISIKLGKITLQCCNKTITYIMHPSITHQFKCFSIFITIIPVQTHGVSYPCAKHNKHNQIAEHVLRYILITNDTSINNKHALNVPFP